MQFDEDIVPLMEKMNAALDRVHQCLLPLLSSLDEDMLVSNYTVDEQARISLSAASALLFLTYAHDRLLNRAQGAGEDQQLMLKINRVTEYIGKLREITSLECKPRSSKGQTQQEGHDGDVSEVRNRKRERGEPPEKATKYAKVDDGRASKGGALENVKADGEDASVDPYGDAILFKEIERKGGKTSALVQNLLQHVTGTNNS
ncbi:exosome-associated protein 3 [Trypanosoma equiperdum]|uniref:Exosome-associated protein 3 n=4 Tax=Trypanozoon TaxID=39700 RepID=Q582G1_TRYB2|nr:3' exoribonuclease, putative [Trypanosoma brucei gambiense DAL972]XP_846169.1 exosome-associated protein 3 [Trypanosoma brucei brucei TREU927]AAX78870.1 exosome-associated protein 3 [Trypanosoma brucei]RHW71422.1 exosome-associated protein 3 [Trypanosoma brucei equiperdum]SCU72710.1 exosome-associated protein 3 [Trypanosoma equiperdum]AAZ12610.1 exosome-associated protein 3 [Trypanosoma brucei brucei TREU927]CBH12740.1 3' exoribonuclease, putative [Trypanosoma brucei gambiense DAL972]|eukprot:XP_011775020.1 3' exoribonuclease, putative [Trypanosoma brucei gambiense DAL972]